MASLTSFSSSSSFTYDVFLNFRGEDTRLGFTCNLYHALSEHRIRTFIEDWTLQRGEHIEPTLFKAIEESMIAITVFSQDYVSSPLCLDQLIKITECMKMGMIVLPIFYHVDPFHVRNQTGTYGEAFAKHEERFRNNMDKVQKWRMALSQIATMSGWIIKNGTGNQYEYEFIKDIVKEVSNRITVVSPPHVSKHRVEYENDFIGSIAEDFSNKINGEAHLHAESQLLEICLLLDEFDDRIHKTSKRVLEAHVRVWRLVGLAFSVVGLQCYALSPSFTRLIGGWNPLKIVLYGVLAFAIWAIILFAKQHSFSWQSKLTTIMGFVVFMLTNVYSFYFDKATPRKPDILSMVSNGVLALTSLILSRVFEFRFDWGIFSCFLALLAAQLMTIHFLLILVVIIFGIPLYVSIHLWIPDRRLVVENNMPQTLIREGSKAYEL